MRRGAAAETLLPEAVLREVDALLAPADAQAALFAGDDGRRQPVHTVLRAGRPHRRRTCPGGGASTRCALLDEHAPDDRGVRGGHRRRPATSAAGSRAKLGASRSRTCGSTSRTATACGRTPRRTRRRWPPAARWPQAPARPGGAADVRRPGQVLRGARPGAARCARSTSWSSAAVRPAACPPRFVVVLPKVTLRRQVTALRRPCARRWRPRTAWPPGRCGSSCRSRCRRPSLGPDGAATVARLVHAGGRPVRRACTTGRTTTAPPPGVAAGAAGAGPPGSPTTPRRSCSSPPPAPASGSATGRRTSLPVGRRRAGARRLGGCTPGWSAARCERGLYQGWDLHPAQLLTRFAATYAFLRAELAAQRRPAAGLRRPRRPAASSTSRRRRRRSRRRVLRGLDCGACRRRPTRSTASGLDRGGAGRASCDGRPDRRAGPGVPGPAGASRPAGEVGARDRRQGRHDRRDRAARRAARGRARWSSWATTTSCCPAWSTRTCTSTSPAAPSGRASRPRPARRRPAASRRSSTCRSTASRRRRRRRPCELKRRPRPRPGVTSTSASGAARCPATWPTCAALHDAGVFGFKCFLLHSGVDEFPHLDADELAGGAAPSCAAFGALLIVHAEDADAIDRAAGRDGERVPRLPRVPPARRRERRDRPVIELARWTGAGCTCCTCRSSDALPMIAAARRDGVADHRRDLPALPDASPPRRSRTAPRSSSAARRSARRRTASAVGRAARRASSTAWSATTRRARRSSSGSTPATSARRGAASRRCSSGCRRCGPQARQRGFTLADVVRWMCAAPGGPGRPAPQGPHRARARRRPRRCSPRTRRSWSTRPAAPPQPGHAVRRAPARRRGALDVAARVGTGRRAASRAGALLSRGAT